VAEATGSLVEALDYQVPTTNAAQRAVWRVAATRGGSWLFAKTMPRLDRVVLSASKGRITLPGVLAGIPVLTLVTTGARTGRLRSSPLLGVPTEGNLAVIGTQFGQPGTPSWVVNLRAHPQAEVRYRGRAVPVRARAARDDEYGDIWNRGRRIYAGYEAYARRISDRRIDIVVLEVGGTFSHSSKAG
jgi:deazaflavin-dependent oxidoreductase (nitroreductase family)